jgi:hypothetical protein
MCVYYQSKKKISEQPCSNGEPIRNTVLWEGIRTTHKLPGSPMGHVPMLHSGFIRILFLQAFLPLPHVAKILCEEDAALKIEGTVDAFQGTKKI